MQVGERISSLGSIVSGVPQGYILELILFVTFTFDIFNVAHKSYLETYADDTQLLPYFDHSELIWTSEMLNKNVPSDSEEHTRKYKTHASITKVIMIILPKTRGFHIYIKR